MADRLTKEKVDLEDVIVKWLEKVEEGVIFDDSFLASPEQYLYETLRRKEISTEDGEISRALNSLLEKGKIKLCVYQRGYISFYLVGSDRDRYGVCVLWCSLLD